MKLLVIDDEPVVLNGIVSLVPFDELGITSVFESDNGLAALQIVEKELPDIILCDINMPKMNGLDFSRQVKQCWPFITIGIITGYDYFEYAKEAIKIGVEDFVLKPVSKQDIMEVIIRLIKKSREQKKVEEVYHVIHSKEQNSKGKEHSTKNKENTQNYRQQIDEYMNEQLSNEEFSLVQLALHLSLNESYASTLFKKLYLTTFSEYLLTKRLEKSKILLLTTEMKNYQIAQAIGISDPNYFSTVFKKQYHLTPLTYRKKFRG